MLVWGQVISKKNWQSRFFSTLTLSCALRPYLQLKTLSSNTEALFDNQESIFNGEWIVRCGRRTWYRVSMADFCWTTIELYPRSLTRCFSPFVVVFTLLSSMTNHITRNVAVDWEASSPSPSSILNEWATTFRVVHDSWRLYASFGGLPSVFFVGLEREIRGDNAFWNSPIVGLQDRLPTKPHFFSNNSDLWITKETASFFSSPRIMSSSDSKGYIFSDRTQGCFFANDII